MDRFIEALPAKRDDDLMLCLRDGVAYQCDMDHRVAYDRAYFEKYRTYEGSPVAQKINAGRIALVKRHYGGGPLLDIGVGSGEFIKRRGKPTFGYDINMTAKRWLLDEGLWCDVEMAFPAYSFWDVLEHVPEPEDYFRHVLPGAYLFTALPIFDDLTRIRESKHYRPDEHLYYWTREGFIRWMANHAFEHLETSHHEIFAGRQSILAFAFRRGDNQKTCG